MCLYAAFWSLLKEYKSKDQTDNHEIISNEGLHSHFSSIYGEDFTCLIYLMILQFKYKESYWFYKTGFKIYTVIHWMNQLKKTKLNKLSLT